MKARDVMTTGVITVTPTTSISEIAATLLEKRISAVPVVDEAGRLVGIVSEGDLLRRHETATERRRPRWLSLLLDRGIQAAEFTKTHGDHAQDVMSRDVVSVSPDTDLSDIAQLLEERRIKRVPVVDGGRLVGIVSRANLLQGLVVVGRRPEAVRDATAATNDKDLRERLDEALRLEPWIDTSRLNVVVSDGIVHLWGMVKSDDQRRALYVAAENVPGVRGVEDHLTPNRFVSTAG